MAYRKLEDTDKKVIQAVQKLGAEGGIKAVTVKKVSELCDVSTFTVATCFGNMQGALDAARNEFEKRYYEKVDNMVERKLSLEQMWDEVVEFYLDDPDGSSYYYEYNHYFGIDISEYNEYIINALNVSKKTFSSKKDVSDKTYLILWHYVTAQGLSCARRINKGFLENTEENKNLLKSMVFGSIYDII